MTGADHTEKVMSKVGIIGLGFVGLPLALAFIHKGFEVIGIDLDVFKINKLNEKKSYLLDVEEAEISHVISSKRLKVSSDYNDISEVDSIIICVPTPLTPLNAPDLSYLTDTCNRLFPLLKKNQLVVLESSTYPGTTKEIVLPILEQSNLLIGNDFFLAYSPERIDPGNKKFSIDKIPKVVSGVTDRCLKKVYALYDQVFDQVVVVSTTEAAETTKLLENTFRLVNISFINEFAKICDKMNVNVWEIIDAASTKPYGFTAFYPSAGAGGHCIPVDPLYLQWKANEYGIQSQFIKISHHINETMPNYIWERLQAHLTQVKSGTQAHVLVYGVTYKKDTPDIRESTAINLIQLLDHEGVTVSYHDPLIPALQINGKTMNSVRLTEEVLKEADCVLIHTNHTNIPLAFILKHSSLVYDSCNATSNMTGTSKVIKLGGGLG